MKSQPRLKIAATKTGAARTLSFLREEGGSIDLLIISDRLQDRGGVELCGEIKSLWPWVPLLLYSAEENAALLDRANALNVDAVVSKFDHHQHLLKGVECLKVREKYVSPRLATIGKEAAWRLTDRQCAVLQLLAEGMGNADIGRHLSVGPETVKSHIQAAMKKLGATDRAQAVAIALRLQLIR